MIMWLILAGYLAGWVVGARIAIRMRMERLTCNHRTNRHTEFLGLCREFHGPSCAVPVGQLRGREVYDGAVALLFGAIWPLVIAINLILHSVPATPGESIRLLAEQQRRIEAQAKDIERLNRMIQP